ncbi:MAG: aminoacyl-tRNA hydrolase [Alphaproteobacteria bacterium]|nr:aminoacyl-tRNA hydrolase [Alphaproteobacteria bacterium]
MFLIVGLGNPGAQYAHTRHNVGFKAVDVIAEKYGFSAWREKFDGLIAEGKIGGEKVYLLKPQTFMNLSGNSVVKTAMFYKILPDNIVVIHDDIDLPIDKIKAKTGGSSGGHNGIKSIDSHITNAYHRIRIGVGRPKSDAVSYVLSGFSKEELENLYQNIEIIANNIDVLLQNGIAAFCNKIGMLKA